MSLSTWMYYRPKRGRLLPQDCAACRDIAGETFRVLGLRTKSGLPPGMGGQTDSALMQAMEDGAPQMQTIGFKMSCRSQPIQVVHKDN